jgi:hypothetical protein
VLLDGKKAVLEEIVLDSECQLYKLHFFPGEISLFIEGTAAAHKFNSFDPHTFTINLFRSPTRMDNHSFFFGFLNPLLVTIKIINRTSLVKNIFCLGALIFINFKKGLN